MHVSAGGSTSVQSLQGSETVLRASPLETAAAMMSVGLGDLQLAIERVDFACDIEDVGVGLVVTSDFRRQSPVVGAASQVHCLVIGRRLARDGVDKPHGEWLGRGITDVGGGGEQVVLEDGISLLSEGAESEWNRAIAQLDVACLAHDVVGVGDDEVWETAVVLFKPLRALCVGLARHLCSKISELLAELFDLGFGLEMLEGAADGRVGETDGDGVEGGGIELWVPLHDIERTLRGEGIVMVMDAGYDLALFGVRVGGDGKVRTFDGRLGRLGGWCA